jgi:tetratricopeptide (TPR) repeat protein
LVGAAGASARISGGDMRQVLGFAVATILVALAGAEAAAQVPFAQVITDHGASALAELIALDDERVEVTRLALEEQDVLHHEIEICIDPRTHAISGESAITVLVQTAHVRFRLNEQLSVLSVRLSGGRRLPHERSGPLLEVSVPEGVGDEPIKIEVRYEGEISGELVRMEPDLVLLGAESNWHPAPIVHDPATFHIVVRYPEGYSSVATGTLSGMAPSLTERADPCADGDIWRVDSPVTRVAAGAGRFESTLSVLGDVFVNCLTIVPPSADGLPGRAPNPRLEDSGLKPVVRFLETCFGPYPFGWLNIVNAPVNAAANDLEPPAVVMGPGFVVARTGRPRAPLPRDPIFYASELSRSWWPYLVDAGPLVSQGLAGYAELAWLEATGDDEATAQSREAALAQYVYALIDSGGRAPLMACLGPSPSSDFRLCRGKGPAIFELLEHLIGRDAFCRALGEVAREHAGEVIGLREIVDAFETASGSDLGWYFYEWIYRGDLPTYVLEYESVASGGGHLVRGKISQEGEIYRTPLPLTIDLGVWSYEEWVTIESAGQTFEFETELKPFAVLMDTRRLVPRVEAAELAEAHFGRGLAAGLSNEWGRAVEEFRKAAALNPGASAYQFWYGEALVNLGRLAEGLEVLEATVAADPTDPSRRMWLARLYLRLNDYEAALGHLERHRAERPDDPAVYGELVIALVGLGRLEEADESVAALLSLGGSEDGTGATREDVYVAAGRFHEASGDTGAAIRSYGLALKANPELDEARQRLEILAANPE